MGWGKRSFGASFNSGLADGAWDGRTVAVSSSSSKRSTGTDWADAEDAPARIVQTSERAGATRDFTKRDIVGELGIWTYGFGSILWGRSLEPLTPCLVVLSEIRSAPQRGQEA